MNKHLPLLLGIAWLFTGPVTAESNARNQVKVANGIMEGTFEPASGVRAFKGIPFAQPPVGELRWKPPQPSKNWEGMRKADKFGPRAMQRPIFSDMKFRSNGMSEDCLYLNVWTPAKSEQDRLPVLVYFYGGGFMAGDGSEGRYDGESMAQRGIVAVTVNYRLTVFGFLAHPELTQESAQHASGNYGLLDQAAALRWVRDNIAAFGGDPDQVTIAGESAGSISVSALMASPLSKSLLARAIGESGSLLGTLTPVSLTEAEQNGVKFATNNDANSLAELRALPAEKLLEATAKPGTPRFALTVDGYFLPKNPATIFEVGEQAKVPLLVGWNSEEMNYRAVLGRDEPTLENFDKAIKRLYPNHWEQALQVYKPAHSEEVIQVATDLAGDRFISYGTWKWADVQSKTGGKPVYRYYYAHPRPRVKSEIGNNNAPSPARGAVHSAEIEYAMGNLSKNDVYAWTPEDHQVSEVMQSYFANFIKTGDPNGQGLSEWPAINQGQPARFMRLDVEPRVETEQHRDRYLFLDRLASGLAGLPRSTPEAQGVSSSAILAFVQAADKSIDALHSFMLLRHGQVIAEGWWSPYEAQSPHMLFSLSKSFTSTAVGLAIAEGKFSLDDEVLKFFSEDAPAEPSNNLKAMRVRDLLRMNTGHESEPSRPQDQSWKKAFLQHPVRFKPGTHFLYNTSATYMLSAIVEKTTGMSLLAYLRLRLFQPLGIENPTWEISPEGITTGGYGLSIRTEDIARFGQLYLQKGHWQGKQLIPKAWIQEATSFQTSNGSNPKSDWDQGYGYQFWRCRNGCYRGDGAFGQYCIVLPEQDAVIAITGGLRDMQAVLNLVWDKLFPAMTTGTLPPNEAAQKQLERTSKNLSLRPQEGSTYPPGIFGKTYEFPANARKLESLRLENKHPDSITMVIHFNGVETRIDCGHNAWKKGQAAWSSLKSQPIAASGAWTAEDTFTAKICLSQTPFIHTVNLQFTGDELHYNSEANVGFGPTQEPELVGTAVKTDRSQ